MSNEFDLLDLPRLKVPDDGAWRDKANCKGADIELFFPNGRGRQTLERIAQMKACCNGCSVRKECLDFALNNDIHDGVYGGLSPRERKGLSKSFCNGSEEGM